MTNKITYEVRWGIIGAGNVCEVKSGPALQLANNSKLIAVMRRNGEKAKDFALRHQIPKWYDNADDLINDPDINAIYIATPPNSHKKYALMAAKVGKPVYVEKPMARNYQECVSMIEACKKANVPLFVAYYRRVLPNILKVKEIIESGVIGDIRFVNIKLQKQSGQENESENNWRIDPEISGGGYFYDLASHQLDTLDFLFGPIVEAQGFANNQAKKYPAEDVTIGSFRFANGIIGNGIWAFNTGEVSEIELTKIVGSKGQIYFPFFGDNRVTLEVDRNSKEIFSFKIPKHIQLPLIQTIVDNILGKGKCISTGKSAARTNWVMEKICKRID